MINVFRLAVPRAAHPRGPTFGLTSSWSPRWQSFVEAMHEVPGMVFQRPRGPWVGYPDAIALALAALKVHGFAVPAFDPGTPGGIPADVTLPVAYAGLRDYQKEGVRFLIAHANTGALLADDMGVGKSIQAVRAARAFKRPTLIVCPSYARSVWGGPGNEIEKWWPDAGPPRVLEGVMNMPFHLRRANGKLILYTGTDATPRVFSWREAQAWIKHNKIAKGVALTPVPIQLPVAQVTVVHYDVLYAWAPHLHDSCETTIFDEPHSMVNAAMSGPNGPRGPRRSAAALDISVHAKQVIALTGTPIPGLPATFYNVLNIISPGRYGSYYDYTRRYAGGRMEQVTEERKAWVADKATNGAELHDRVKHIMLRRTKSEVAAELPARTRLIVDVDVPRKYATTPGTALKSGRAIRKALELAGLGKIPEAIARAVAASETEKVVVYTRLRASAEAIAAGVRAAGQVDVNFIHGGILYKQRLKRMRAEPRVLVTTMDVVAGGISFIWSSLGIFAELHPSPQTILQCEARHHRIGALRAVVYQYLIARGSLDELLKNRMLDKLDAFETTIGKLEDGLTEDLAGKSDEEVLAGMFADLMNEER